MLMKLQDIVFLIILIALLVKKNPRWFVIFALTCFAVATPLFARWIFFTAERLTWYGAAFIATSLLISLKEHR